MLCDYITRAVVSVSLLWYTYILLNHIPLAHHICWVSTLFFCLFQTSDKIFFHQFSNLKWGEICTLNMIYIYIFISKTQCENWHYLSLIHEQQACCRQLHQHQEEQQEEELLTEFISQEPVLSLLLKNTDIYDNIAEQRSKTSDPDPFYALFLVVFFAF